MKNNNLAIALLFSLTSLYAHADITNAEKLAHKYSAIAKHINAQYAGPSAAEGKLFFNQKIKILNGKKIACASCHTKNPADPGKHIITGKKIAPLSPAIYIKRFNNLDKVEDQFTQHCNDILGNDCSAEQKADFITYLITEKTPSTEK